jgi:hypothetical protein
VAVTALRWLGVPAGDVAAMRRFFETLGLSVLFEEPGTVELETSGGDRVQIYDRSRLDSIVPLFEVDDAPAERDTLTGRGLRVGELRRDSAWQWFEVRGPDGLVVEIGSRL